MRKIIGFVLLALAAALLAIGVVATVWAPGQVKKTPVDINTTTRLEGTAAKYDAETGALGEARPVGITSLTRTDSEASDDSVAVFVAQQCVVFTDDGDVPDCGTTDAAGENGDDRVVSIGVDRFATDRVSALAVDEEGYVPEPFRTTQHDGIVNKFPFDTEKKAYPYWDSLTGQAWPAEFVEVEDVQGLETYHFRVSIDRVEAEVAEGTSGRYSNVADIWVEPATGAIVRQTQDQQRYLESGDQVLDLQADFTDDQLDTSVAATRDSVKQLDTILKTAPLVGFIGGALLLVAGAFLVLSTRRKKNDYTTSGHIREPVSADI